MKKLSALFLLLLLAGSTFADIARPDKPNKTKPQPRTVTNGRMSIYPRTDVKVATLKIKRETFNRLRAAAGTSEGDNNAALFGGPGRTQTLIAGILASAAMVMVGFLFMRKSSRGSKIAGATALVAMVGFGVVASIANVPPPRSVALTSNIFNTSTMAYGYARGEIAIEIVDEKEFGASGDDVILDMPAAKEEAKPE